MKWLSIVKTHLKFLQWLKKLNKNYRSFIKYRFCEKEKIVDEVRDHCHLTGKYRGPTHNQCNTNVTHKRNFFVPFAIQNISDFVCHLFFKRLVDKRNDKVKIDPTPKTIEEYTSQTKGCTKFLDNKCFY